MGKIVTVTSEEIRREWTPEKLREWSKSISSLPEDCPDPITDEDVATGRVKFIGRGFASYQEYISRNASPKEEVKTAKVSSRRPVAVAAEA